MKKETRGGRRENSGRKKKEPTITVSFRILPKLKEQVVGAVKKITKPS